MCSVRVRVSECRMTQTVKYIFGGTCVIAYGDTLPSTMCVIVRFSGDFERRST